MDSVLINAKKKAEVLKGISDLKFNSCIQEISIDYGDPVLVCTADGLPVEVTVKIKFN